MAISCRPCSAERRGSSCKYSNSNNQSVDIGVLIPKFKATSEDFTNTIYGGAIEVVALPMVSIVGEGLVVNVEILRKGLPSNTYEGHQIPTDFDFPIV